ncbi:hypothetical protein C8Q76DRAFT_266685 [Earliella scabrosa]|nr:hypothetical protein C8Q76DRAFT_266685 [Earliella scabrosa]
MSAEDALNALAEDVVVNFTGCPVARSRFRRATAPLVSVRASYGRRPPLSSASVTATPATPYSTGTRSPTAGRSCRAALRTASADTGAGGTLTRSQCSSWLILPSSPPSLLDAVARREARSNKGPARASRTQLSARTSSVSTS